MKLWLLFFFLMITSVAFPMEGFHEGKQPGTFVGKGKDYSLFFHDQTVSCVYYSQEGKTLNVTRVDLKLPGSISSNLKISSFNYFSGKGLIESGCFESLTIHTDHNVVKAEFKNGNPVLAVLNGKPELDVNGADALIILDSKVWFDVQGVLFPFPFVNNLARDTEFITSSNIPVITPQAETARWSTFLGGSVSDDLLSVAVSGNLVYTCGSTQSNDLPSTIGSFQDTLGGYYDGIVSCYTKSGVKKWTSYLGGSNLDIANSISSDSMGHCYIGGYTNSPDFPAAGNGIAFINGSYDAFITKFDSSGNVLHSGFFGGTAGDFLYAMKVDATGSFYIGGGTTSQNLPVQAGSFQPFHAGAIDAYVARFNSEFQLKWCTYLGGGGSEDMHAMTCDQNSSVIFCGGTYSPDFPTQNPMQPFTAGGADVYLTKLDSSGNMVFSTYYGGASHDDAFGVTTDNLNEIYVTGYTPGNDLVFGSSAFQQVNHGGFDSFVIKISPSGAFRKGTYFGGMSDDQASGISYGNDLLHVGGSTFSTDLPVDTLSLQSASAGGYDGFYAVFDTALSYQTSAYYGSTGYETVYAIAYGSDSTLFLAGKTSSPSLPYSEFGDKDSTSGGEDGFLVRLKYIHTPNQITEKERIEIKIYPVPACDYLYVAEKDVRRISIRTIQGQVMKSILCESDLTRISLNDLSAGTYLISLEKTDGSLTTSRFIKL